MLVIVRDIKTLPVSSRLLKNLKYISDLSDNRDVSFKIPSNVRGSTSPRLHRETLSPLIAY